MLLYNNHFREICYLKVDFFHPLNKFFDIFLRAMSAPILHAVILNL
jgi:hypothetical protein